MIDVHVLTHSATRPEWLAQCLASLADEPCTVHVVEGVERNIAAGREKGFGLGAHPFVTFVDSDDYVLPGAMRAVCESLQDHGAVVTRERVLTEAGFAGEISGHHLFAARREVLAPHLQDYGRRFAKAHCCANLAYLTNAALIPVTTYVWRMHPKQSHSKVHTW